MINLRLFIVVLCLITQSFLFFGVFTWCHEGHEAIGMAAMSFINSKTSSQLKRFLGGKDIVDISSWGHKTLERNPQLASLHFLLQPASTTCNNLVISNTTCQNNNCLVGAIQYFYSRLMGKPDSTLGSLSNLSFTDSDSLKYLVTLLGDLHQPLRLGFQHNEGGKTIEILKPSETNSGAPPKSTNMFDYWESDLITFIAESNPSFWYGGWTHANSLGSSLLSLKEEWMSTPFEKKRVLFEKWAKDSFKKACDSVYKDSRNNQDIPNGFETTMDYDFLCFEIIRTQLLTAGVRIALVLDTVFKYRDATQLRQGSAFDNAFESRKPSNVSAGSHNYFRNFCINICIILATLGILVYVLRFYTPHAQPLTSAEMSSKPKGIVMAKATDKFS